MGTSPFEIQSIRGSLKDLTHYTTKVRCVCGSLVPPSETMYLDGLHYRVYQQSITKEVKDCFILFGKYPIKVEHLYRCGLTSQYFDPIRTKTIKYDDTTIIMFNPLIHYVYLNSDLQLKAYSSIDLIPTGYVRKELTNRFYIYVPKSLRVPDRVYEYILSMYNNTNLQTHANKNNPVFNLTQLLYQNYKIQKNNRILHTVASLFQGYTFGCEFEICDFTFELPEVVTKCLTPLNDSSIGGNGLELATPVLTGYKGLSYLLDISTILRDKATANPNCAFHIHIGAGLKRSEIVALYYLYTRIQTEISAFLLNYLKDPVSIGRKQKNYAEHIPQILDAPHKDIQLMSQLEYRDYINKSFIKLFTLFRGRPSSKQENRDVYQETGVPWENTWKSASRYYNLNLYNYFFTGIPTVEIRAHQGTTSPYRIMHFLLIQLAIIKFTKENTNEILNLPTSRNKITLDDIIRRVYKSIPSLVSYLLAYIALEKSNRNQELINSIESAHSTAGGTAQRNQVIYQQDNLIIRGDKEYKYENDLDLLCLEETNSDLFQIPLMGERSEVESSSTRIRRSSSITWNLGTSPRTLFS